MIDTTTFVGPDVHARSIKAVALDIMTGEVRTAAFGYDAASAAQWTGSIDAAARCAYEPRMQRQPAPQAAHIQRVKREITL